MANKKFFTGIFVAVTLFSFPVHFAYADPAISNNSNIIVDDVAVEEVKKHFKKMKLPVSSTRGSKYDANMVRSACTWRSLTKNTYSRGKLTAKERKKVLSFDSLPVPKDLVVGLNINRACQTVIWVTRDENTKQKKVKKVFPASTGKNSTPTPKGTYKIYRETNRWHESTSFPGAMMYRPKYFRGGVALHGSITDGHVLPYPASAGCVRMLQRDVNQLWKNNVSLGTKVKVYGDWKP
jgi:lipoprotein-anchoring transpeptidase ErfK/SrfK